MRWSQCSSNKRRYKGKVYESFLLRWNNRDGDNVKQRTVGNLSHLRCETIELLRCDLGAKR